MENNQPYSEESEQQPDYIAQAVLAKVRRTEQALSPWVQRSLQAGVDSKSQRKQDFRVNRPMAFTTANALSLLDRVQRLAERSVVWRADEISINPDMVDRFAGEVANRFQLKPIAIQYELETPETGPEQPGAELALTNSALRPEFEGSAAASQTATEAPKIPPPKKPLWSEADYQPPAPPHFMAKKQQSRPSWLPQPKETQPAASKSGTDIALQRQTLSGQPSKVRPDPRNLRLFSKVEYVTPVGKTPASPEYGPASFSAEQTSPSPEAERELPGVQTESPPPPATEQPADFSQPEQPSQPPEPQPPEAAQPVQARSTSMETSLETSLEASLPAISDSSETSPAVDPAETPKSLPIQKASPDKPAKVKTLSEETPLPRTEPEPDSLPVVAPFQRSVSADPVARVSDSAQVDSSEVDQIAPTLPIEETRRQPAQVETGPVETETESKLDQHLAEPAATQPPIEPKLTQVLPDQVDKIEAEVVRSEMPDQLAGSTTTAVEAKSKPVPEQPAESLPVQRRSELAKPLAEAPGQAGDKPSQPDAGAQRLPLARVPDRATRQETPAQPARLESTVQREKETSDRSREVEIAQEAVFEKSEKLSRLEPEPPQSEREPEQTDLSSRPIIQAKLDLDQPPLVAASQSKDKPSDLSRVERPSLAADQPSDQLTDEAPKTGLKPEPEADQPPELLVAQRRFEPTPSTQAIPSQPDMVEGGEVEATSVIREPVRKPTDLEAPSAERRGEVEPDVSLEPELPLPPAQRKLVSPSPSQVESDNAEATLEPELPLPPAQRKAASQPADKIEASQAETIERALGPSSRRAEVDRSSVEGVSAGSMGPPVIQGRPDPDRPVLKTPPQAEDQATPRVEVEPPTATMTRSGPGVSRIEPASGSETLPGVAQRAASPMPLAPRQPKPGGSAQDVPRSIVMQSSSAEESSPSLEQSIWTRAAAGWQLPLSQRPGSLSEQRVARPLPVLTPKQARGQLVARGWRFKRKVEDAPADPRLISRAMDELEQGQSAGKPLADEPRARVERTLGRDFSGVRLRTAQLAPLNVEAATQGSDVYVEPGQDRFETPQSLALLGHELTHVAQRGLAQTKSVAQTAILPQTRGEEVVAEESAVVRDEEDEALSAEQRLLGPGQTQFPTLSLSGAPRTILRKPASTPEPGWSGQQGRAESQILPGAIPEPVAHWLASAELAQRQPLVSPVASNVISRQEETSAGASSPTSPSGEATEQPAGQQPDLDQLARQIYPLIKRLLSVERERSPGRSRFGF